MQMTLFFLRRPARHAFVAATSLLGLAACDQPFDYDLRGGVGGFSTAEVATQTPVASRPTPDSRGVISYPSYQVAVAQRGDTINDVATRLGFSAQELARYNGVEPDVPLRQGEIIALPGTISGGSVSGGTGQVQPGAVDIGTLAGNAINRAPASSGGSGVQVTALQPAQASVAQQIGTEPIQHKVERGETAYTVARLYAVPVKALAEWNGLGPDFAIREGQYLLIPVAKQAAPERQEAVVTLPGTGSPTPTPPSAVKPLPPASAARPASAAPKPSQPVANVGATTAATPSAAMVFPVSGTIIREYVKGKNDGINIKSAPGTAVKAADAGTVAAITKSGDGFPIVVIRHDADLMTIYANVDDVSVEKGATVTRGQSIAKLRSGDDAYVHFEIRNGFESLDPMPYLQ
jgi:murein DD-endopeptidase MepM/ murein hydrolase activator NlpD